MAATEPRFSILIPAYNAEATLARTLDSLIAQTYDDWECVVIDDGSTDGTAAILERYVQIDSRFRGTSQENGGTASALNAAAKLAQGQFFVQLGADDELLPEYCEATLKLIEQNPEYDIYAANAWQVFPDGQKQFFNRGMLFESEVSINLDALIQKSLIYCTAATRREIFTTLGGFRTEIYNEDYDFWLRALASGARHIYQPLALSLYHATPNQKTSDALKVRESDCEILSDLAASESLSENQLELLHAKLAELQQNIALRKKLYRIMGSRLTEAIIAKTRPMREGH